MCACVEHLNSYYNTTVKGPRLIKWHGWAVGEGAFRFNSSSEFYSPRASESSPILLPRPLCSLRTCACACAWRLYVRVCMCVRARVWPTTRRHAVLWYSVLSSWCYYLPTCTYTCSFCTEFHDNFRSASNRSFCND